jgi:hypothetical protein
MDGGESIYWVVYYLDHLKVITFTMFFDKKLLCLL